MSTAALVSVSLLGHGFVSVRVLSPSAFLQVISGLIWGAVFGYLIKEIRSRGQASALVVRWLGQAGLLIALAIGIGVTAGHARLIPGSATYAREWDERHAEIWRQSRSGVSTVYVPEFTVDPAEHVGVSTIFDYSNNRCPKQYFGVESIQPLEA